MCYAECMSDTDYTALLLEELRDQNKAILEYVTGVPEMAARLKRLEEQSETMATDMKVMKAALTDTSNQMADHDHRLATVEAVWTRLADS